MGTQDGGALARKNSDLAVATLSKPMRSSKKQIKSCRKNHTNGGVLGKNAWNQLRNKGDKQQQGGASSSCSESASSLSSSVSFGALRPRDPNGNAHAAPLSPGELQQPGATETPAPSGVSTTAPERAAASPVQGPSAAVEFTYKETAYRKVNSGGN